MKKRLLSFVTALVMIAGFCIPASAAGINPDGYYNMGFDGAFYYRYASGPNINKETGIPFSCSVSMNSNNG